MSGRTRLIKPWVLDDDRLARISPCRELALLCGLLVDRLPLVADREGRLPGRAAWVWKTFASLFPQNDRSGGEAEIDQCLDLLHRAKFLRRYRAESDEWIQLLTFKEDQSPHHQERKSEIPPPPDYDEGETAVLPFGPYPVENSRISRRSPGDHREISRRSRSEIPLSRNTVTPPLAPPRDDDDERPSHLHPEDLDAWGPAPNSESPDPHPRWLEFVEYAGLEPGARFLDWLTRRHPEDPAVAVEAMNERR